MRKCSLGLVMVLMSISLCACGAKKDTSKQSEAPSSAESVDVTEMEKKEENKEGEEKEEEKKEEEKKEEEKKEEVLDTEENNLSSEQEDTSYPGKDVVVLVNLRGDKVTVYKLADGNYMDRASKVYTYDGIETWTDEDGVTWNEALQ